MKQGMIILWFGAPGAVPYGWRICDGTLDTPDLAVRWIVGAGDTFDVGDDSHVGEHEHTFTSNGHNHSLPVTPPENFFTADLRNYTTIDPIIGTTNKPVVLPPYHALYFIMKMNS